MFFIPTVEIITEWNDCLNQYVIINGTGSSGKDEFIKQCKLFDDNIENISTIDFVKSLAKYAGWDGKKDERGRRLLSDLKDALVLYDDIPFKETLTNVEMFSNKTVFIHCREPDEIRKLKEALSAKTLLIKNSNVDGTINNHADKDVNLFCYDYVVDNSTTLGDLIIFAQVFLLWLKNSK